MAAGKSAAPTASIDEGEFRRAVAGAIDGGITCFDTAEAYGMGISEEALAGALGLRPNDVVIATKFGVGYEEMPSRRDSSRVRVLASIPQESAAVAHRSCRHLSGVIGPIPIRRSTRRWRHSTTSCARARCVVSAAGCCFWCRGLKAHESKTRPLLFCGSQNPEEGECGLHTAQFWNSRQPILPRRAGRSAQPTSARNRNVC